MQLNTALSHAVSFKVGQKYGGGVVFYVDSTGLHGLIASTKDVATPFIDPWNKTSWSGVYRWSTGQEETVNNSDYAFQVLLDTSSELGQGAVNTQKILEKYPASSYPYTAAAAARSYRGGGFRDWFLPSQDELNLLYVNRTLVGSFAADYYWSSSEKSAEAAWSQYFSDGYLGGGTKSYYSRVRPVRAF